MSSFEQPDPTTLLLNLADGVRFQDVAPANGRALTADDVVFSLRRVSGSQPEFIHSDLFSAVLDIEAAGADQVRLRLREAFAPLTRYLAAPWAAIIPRELLELHGSLAQDAAGTGAYRLAAWKRFRWSNSI